MKWIKSIGVCLIAIFLVCCVGCQYTNPSGNSTGDGYSFHEYKRYSSEEVTKINKASMYPKEYIKSIGESFETKYFIATVNEVKVLNNVNGLDPNDFWNYEGEILPHVDENGDFIPHDVKGEVTIYGGLETKVVRTINNAHPCLVIVDFTLTNATDEEKFFTVTPATGTAQYTDYDDEFYIQEEGGISYWSVDSDDRVMLMEVMYFPMSLYKNEENAITRSKKFCHYYLEAGETKTFSVGYIHYEELMDETYLSFLPSNIGTTMYFNSQVKLT